MNIRITDIALVFNNHDELVMDRDLLREFDGYKYADERLTDYIGGSAEEDELAALLEPGGYISF